MYRLDSSIRTIDANRPRARVHAADAPGGWAIIHIGVMKNVCIAPREDQEPKLMKDKSFAVVTNLPTLIRNQWQSCVYYCCYLQLCERHSIRMEKGILYLYKRNTPDMCDTVTKLSRGGYSYVWLKVSCHDLQDDVHYLILQAMFEIDRCVTYVWFGLYRIGRKTTTIMGSPCPRDVPAEMISESRRPHSCDSCGRMNPIDFVYAFISQ
mmetsp:Transcript_13019/g.24625  ORF Transcript_13019/g.24625 Transcript_13019/m.24625 type:complete len:209 (+) Transcript_13019:51-677(+)